MKKDIHPATYRPVVFFDTQANMKFLTRSTIETNETIQWEDGETYPLAKVDISSASHPYYTGKKIFIDTAGRVDKFKKRYAKTTEAPKPAPKKQTWARLTVRSEWSSNSPQIRIARIPKARARRRPTLTS